MTKPPTIVEIIQIDPGSQELLTQVIRINGQAVNVAKDGLLVDGGTSTRQALVTVVLEVDELHISTARPTPKKG